MDNVNTRPLLQESESESDISDTKEYGIQQCQSLENETSITVNNTANSFLKPRDPFNVAYIIFYFLGMTVMIPFNFFVTADEYWMYKFRDIHNQTTLTNDDDKTSLQVMFTSYLSVATSVPNTLFLILNAFLGHWISLKLRVLGSLIVILILFIITTAFVKINTDSWQHEFFIIIMVIVVIMNIASAIFSGGLFGIVGKFSSSYVAAVVSGQALSGIFASLTEILSLTFGASALFSALIYFMIANVTLLISICSYIILSKSIFFKYHTSSKQLTLVKFEASSSTANQDTLSYKNILKRIWLYGLSIWLTFLVTLSVYPSVTVLIESKDNGNGNLWNDVYFIPVVCYLLFSLGDYFGRILSGIFQRPKKALIVALLNIVRIVFVPAIMLCNARPRHNLPVFFMNDIYYMIIMALFALSNGYMVNIAMINAPKVVEPHERETASSMMAAFLGIGLASGSALSLVMVEIL